MKIFNVSFSKAPYIHQHYGPHKFHKLYLECLYVLSFFSVIIYGYVALQKLFLVYIVSFIFIWLYRFFDRREIFRGDTWQIYAFIYALMLNPSTSWHEILIGIAVMMLGGLGILYINKQYIFSPPVLGIMVIIAFGVYSEGFDIVYSIHKLFFLVNAKNKDLGEPSLFIALRDVYHLFFGSIEKTYLYHQDPSFITEILPNYYKKFLYFHTQQENPGIWKWSHLLLSRDNFWIGTGSPLVIMILGFFLSLYRVLNGYLILLYIVVYSGLRFLYISLNQGEILISNLFYQIFDHVLLFVSVFLVTNTNTLPKNKNGQIYNVFFIAILAFLFSLGSYHYINHLIAIILGNMMSSFHEIIGRSHIFAVPKNTGFFGDFSYVLGSMPRSILIQRLSLSMLIMLLTCLSVYFVPKDVFLEREDHFYPELIRDFFPSYIIGDRVDEDVYIVQLERQNAGIVFFQTVDGYRDEITIAVLINQGILVHVKMVSVSGEHPLVLQQHWESIFSGLHLDELPKSIKDLEMIDLDIISGATISSSAILHAVNLVKTRYKVLRAQNEEIQ